MERLTCRDSDGNARCRYASSFYEIVDSLAHYEDLEEQMEQILSVHQTMKDFVCACVEYHELSKTKPEITDAMLISNADSKKLKEYKDLEEQGLLLKLPCPIGSTIYKHEYPKRVDAEGVEWKVLDRKRMTVEPFKFALCHLDYIGKWYFLTKSEAEKALVEMTKDCTNCRNYWQNTDTENECNGQDKPCHEFVEMEK